MGGERSRSARMQVSPLRQTMKLFGSGRDEKGLRMMKLFG
jgi:hypothetical protein